MDHALAHRWHDPEIRRAAEVADIWHAMMNSISPPSSGSSATSYTLTGLTGDNGVTDNYPIIVPQLAIASAIGAGEIIVPYGLGYYGVSQDIVLPVGMGMRGEGPYLEKYPGTVGTVAFGASFGPLVSSANTIVNAPVNLTNYGTWVQNLGFVGINATNGTTYGRAANAALYIAGATTNQAVRVRFCTIWGGLVSALNMQSGSDSADIISCNINNSTFQGQQTVQNSGGSTPAGLCVLVQGAADIRFVDLETANGPVQIGYNQGGSDIVFTGGHITGDGINGNGVCPHVFLSSGTGGSFNGTIFDNGSANILCHIQRRKGTWMFNGCRYQNGSIYSYPVFQNDVDTSNTSATGDPYRGIVVNGGHVSGSGGFAGHSCLINYTYTNGYITPTPDEINGLVIDYGRLDTGCSTTNGSPTIGDTSITSADAGKSVIGPGIPAGAFVSPVGHLTPGTSYNLSSSSTTYVALNADATNASVTHDVGPALGGQANTISQALLWKLNGNTSNTIVPSVAKGIVYCGYLQQGIGTVSPVTLPAAATPGTTATQPNAAADTVNYVNVTTAIVGGSLSIGPTNSVGQTVYASIALSAGECISFMLPAGWYYKFGWTSGAVNVVSQALA